MALRRPPAYLRMVTQGMTTQGNGGGGRLFEIVLMGATGFTGALVAEYLVRHGPRDLRWAIAGRDRAKLEAVRRRLAELGGPPELPLVVADSHDRAALDALAGDTKVVCTTVGPYALHGGDLVAACANQGTHYCDLTGEPQWIRRMIDAHHDRASDTGARIVHCCGFDSIPSDIGCFMLQEAAIERYGQPLERIKFFLGRNRGGLSGGTAASMVNLLEEARDPTVRRVLGHPYGLNPAGEQSGPDGSDPKGVGRDPEVPCFTAPFVMAAINTRIVRRSNALMGYRYGRGFRYGEQMSFPYTAKGLAMATAFTAAMAGFLAVAAMPPTRKLLVDRVLPASGAGPTREERENGFFEVRLIGHGKTRDGAEITMGARVEGHQDPGYGETSKMLGESALCLARETLDSSGGVLTPASAMGRPLLERLRRAGMRFDVI